MSDERRCYACDCPIPFATGGSIRFDGEVRELCGAEVNACHEREFSLDLRLGVRRVRTIHRRITSGAARG